MSTVVQPCARCGARWPVQGTPMHWCPRCRGVLLSPGPIDAPAAARNYRWVARRPGRQARSARRRGDTAPAETPRYTYIPRWGLRDVPAVEEQPSRQRPLQALTDRVHRLLIAVAVAFAVAAVAEVGRYLILMYNRSRLVEPLLLAFSDALVTVSALIAPILALLAALAAIGWLLEFRRATYARLRRRDPRPTWFVAAGCLVPVANLLWPGVFLTEVLAHRDDPRPLRAARIWWGIWVVGGVLAATALVWRSADSLQAKADGVLFTALTDVAAAAVAVATLWVLRTTEGRDVRGDRRIGRRWVVAADPAVPVIEPVQPGNDATEDVPDSASGTDVDSRDQVTTRPREQEEVVAK